MMAAVLRLKRGRDARVRVHPWIFKGDVADVSDVEPGSVVTIVDSGGRFVGRGFYNPRPALCCRVITRRDEPVGQALLRRRLAEAVGRRAEHGTPPLLARLIGSEADGLPGLVVDRYGPVVVIQCLTLGMARRRRDVVDGLREVIDGVSVFSADEPGQAALEGFEPQRTWFDDHGPDHVVVEEGPVRIGVTFGQGHKTGLYLDQRENRVRVAAHAGGRAVLDAFAYTAGFACHALVAGAPRAVCLESSPEAISGAHENFKLNDVVDRAEIVAGNAFDELRRLDRSGQRFGLVVLDPPPFARGRDALDAAARGYKEINLRAMKLLAAGGVLATFSCSHHLSAEMFEAICREAAGDAGVSLRVLDRLTQSSDHPEVLTIAETRYVKGLLLEVV